MRNILKWTDRQVRMCVCVIPWCKELQANVSLSLLGKFSVSLLEMQQSPANYEQIKKNTSAQAHKQRQLWSCTVTLCAPADVVPADLCEFLCLPAGRVGATAAMIYQNQQRHFSRTHRISKGPRSGTFTGSDWCLFSYLRCSTRRR